MENELNISNTNDGCNMINVVGTKTDRSKMNKIIKKQNNTEKAILDRIKCLNYEKELLM